MEIFFGIITRQAIRRGTFTSVKDLITSPGSLASWVALQAGDHSSTRHTFLNNPYLDQDRELLGRACRQRRSLAVFSRRTAPNPGRLYRTLSSPWLQMLTSCSSIRRRRS